MRGYLELSAPILRPEPRERLEDRKKRSESMLLSALDQGTTIAFLGSGISAPFGYPSWKDLALGMLKKTVQELGSSSCRPAGLKYIESLQEGARKNSDALDSNALMFLIGACRTILEESGKLPVYYKYFSDCFAFKSIKPALDPFEALLNLPIRRFVTTNYDCEVERALVRYRSFSPRDLGLGPGPGLDALGPEAGGIQRSFTQRLKGTEGLEPLVRFLMEDEENLVFHCHGRHDDPESVVATEADYQQWYLGRDGGASLTYQQSMEFLLRANPMLFIGYSLRDEDLLRPLRQLGALEPTRRGAWPLFALLACSAENREVDQYHHEALFDRFGLHVISFERCKEESLTSALNRELQRLRERLREVHQEWKEKPKLKRTLPLVRPPAPHCEIAAATRVPLKPLPALEEEVRKPGVVVLVGPSGCGKSFHVLQLVTAQSRGFAGTFYWNAHYANESVTAIDAALSYFDPEEKYKGNRFDRIAQGLRENRFLLVLDGCERLLYPGGAAGDGISYSVTFRRLLRVMADPRSRSTVVLAGRLRPAELAKLEPGGGREPLIRFVRVERVEAQDLRQEPLFSGLPPEGLSALCSLLRGHSYGLRLAGEYLKRCPDPREELQVLIGRLADELRDERLRAMVLLLVRKLDREGRCGLTEAFLGRLGLFLSPVCESARDLCFELAWQEVGKGRPGAPSDASELYEELISTGLLFPMHQPGSDKAPTYTLHVTVRASLFQHPHGLEADPLPAFGLSGFTSGRLGIDPDPARRGQIDDVFERLLQRANAKLAEGRLGGARALCRDAYGLLRTRMEANTVPRWCTYDDYLQYGLRVAKLAKRTAPGTWSYCEHPDASRFAEHDEAPLYPAELAWLYNDIAIALSAAGRVRSACSFWEQAFEITRLLEDPRMGGGYHTEILLSLAYSFIERGRLSAASRYLDDAERILRELADDDVEARIHGLRGLIAHLQGNLQRADDLYELCLKCLRFGTNLRAQSIFSKHLADVKLVIQQYDKADLLIRNSRALAESGVFPELVANARISEGHRLARTGHPVQARLEYKTVLQEARTHRCHKLEVRALTALARLALDQKDADGARDHAEKALSLANQHGLALRKTHALVVLGLAILETGTPDLGKAYLLLAKRMADGQEYWGRSREAENKLLELGVDVRGEASSFKPV
jgi:tetratricopeptide (TPR) repeat protein